MSGGIVVPTERRAAVPTLPAAPQATAAQPERSVLAAASRSNR
jgi:hypothetical protein